VQTGAYAASVGCKAARKAPFLGPWRVLEEEAVGDPTSLVEAGDQGAVAFERCVMVLKRLPSLREKQMFRGLPRHIKDMQ